MIKISKQEQEAIKSVLRAGSQYGHGNMIAHLQTAWARELVLYSRMDEKVARESTVRDGAPYPFKMQEDMIERGEWDETGERYRVKK